MLTGESLPADKSASAAGHDDTIGTDARDLVFLGTSVVSGTGTALATATGPKTSVACGQGQRQDPGVLGRLAVSLILFRSSYLSTFGLVVLSKRLDALARVAMLEATLLDEQEAPQREIERERNQTEENRVKHRPSGGEQSDLSTLILVEPHNVQWEITS